MSPSLSLRSESDPSIYGYKHSLKKVCIDNKRVNIPKAIFDRPKCFYLLFRLFGSYNVTQEANALSRQRLLVVL